MSLVRFENEMGFPSNFSSMLDRFFEDAVQKRDVGFTPSVDVAETEKNYEFEVQLPGIKKDDINIEVNGNTLVISGKKERKETQKDKKFHRVESYYGSFRRAFTLPDEADLQKIEANFKDGLLVVNVPKDKEKTGVKRIAIN